VSPPTPAEPKPTVARTLKDGGRANSHHEKHKDHGTGYLDEEDETKPRHHDEDEDEIEAESRRRRASKKSSDAVPEEVSDTDNQNQKGTGDNPDDVHAPDAPSRRNDDGTTELVLTSEKTVLELYQMLKDVTELCELHKITYWVDGGTLLGAIRHGGLIPWDDDVDICVPLEEEEAFEALRGPLKRLGYGMKLWFYGYKVFRLDGLQYPDKPFKYPFMDVFFTKNVKIKDGPLAGKVRTWFPRTNWFRHAFNIVDDLFPLKRYKFGLVSVYGPHTYEPRLLRSYGPNWNSMGERGKDHAKYTDKERFGFDLSDDMRSPALPLGPLHERVFKDKAPPPPADSAEQPSTKEEEEREP